jgi:hypothetical protein
MIDKTQWAAFLTASVAINGDDWPHACADGLIFEGAAVTVTPRDLQAFDGEFKCDGAVYSFTAQRDQLNLLCRLDEI